MAILKVLAVYDVKAAAFNRPLFVPAVGLAERSFADEVNRVAPDNAMNSHPEDFNLFLIGEYDEVSGALSPLNPPSLMVSGASCVKGGV